MSTNNTQQERQYPTNAELIETVMENAKDLSNENICNSSEELKNKDTSFPKDWEKEFDPESTDDQSKKDEAKADDFIDELELKDKEVTYSEEDFKRLKKEAEDFKIKGNDQFKNKEYKESTETYTLALRTCPLRFSKDRSILFANRGAAKVQLELTESAIEDCTAAIELEPNYVRALMRRANLYEKTEKLDEALEDFKKILEQDSSHKEAMEACIRLPPLINERNEKLKTEMLGKLKDLGNMILRPFGLSTNNFQMNQDPSTGGYSVNFKQN